MANKDVIAAKEEAVKNLAADLKESKLVILVDFQGTTVDDDTKLRKELRGVNGKSLVIKNNIIRRALNANSVTELDSLLEGPTAIVSSKEDYLPTLKAIYKFAKEHDNYKIKGGIIEGEIKSVEEINTLAQLPSREELLSKLAGSLLQLVGKLAVALDQVRIQKEADAPAPKAEEKAPEAEAKAEEPAAEAKAEEPAKEEAKVEEEAPKAE